MSDDELWQLILQYEPFISRCAYRIAPRRKDDAKQEIMLFCFLRLKSSWNPDSCAFITALEKLIQWNWQRLRFVLHGKKTNGHGVNLVSERGYYQDAGVKRNSEAEDARLDIGSFCECLDNDQFELIEMVLAGYNLSDIARAKGISRERVRQKYARSLERIRGNFEWNFEE